MVTIKKAHRLLSNAAYFLADALEIPCPTVDLLFNGHSTSATPFPERNTIAIELSDTSDKAILNALYSLAFAIRRIWSTATRFGLYADDKGNAESIIFADSFIEYIMEGGDPLAYVDIPSDGHTLLYLRELFLPIIERIKGSDI